VTQPLAQGRYLLVRPLDRSGPALIWLVWDFHTRVWWAARLLRAEDRNDQALVAYFQAELAALQRVEHPNVVRLHDHGTDGQNSWLILDLPAGGDLGAWIERHGPMPIRMAAEASWSVAHALEATHKTGTAHLDIRPSSVFVDDRGVVRLGSFAFSERGGPTDADVAALGLLLYALLTGHVASDARSLRTELVPPIALDAVRFLSGHGGGIVPDAGGARRELEVLIKLSPVVPAGSPELRRPIDLPNPPAGGFGATPIPAGTRTPIHVASRTGVPAPNQAVTPPPETRQPTPRPAPARTPAPVERSAARQALDAFPFTVAVPISDLYVEDDGVGGLLAALPGRTPAPAPRAQEPVAPPPAPPEPDLADVLLRLAGALGVLVAVLVAAVLFVGKSSVDRSHAAADAREEDFLALLHYDVGVIGEVRALGGNADRLEIAWKAFEAAPPEARTDAAEHFALELDAVWSGTPRGPRAPATDQRVRRIDRARDDLSDAMRRWNASATEGLGQVVVSLGLSSAPPP
jgi:hypothetical protein